jgi:hypothetical protein
MSLPITLTYTFGTQTGTVPASYLDTNFSQITTALNGVGSGSVALDAPNITSFSNTAAILPVVNGGTASSTGNISALNVLASGSTTTRTLAARFGEVANAQDFGAVGDGVTNDTAAILAWITYGLTTGTPMYLPAGTGDYIVTGSTRLNWLLNQAKVQNKGLSVFGDGVQRSVIDVTAVSVSPQVLINVPAAGHISAVTSGTKVGSTITLNWSSPFYTFAVGSEVIVTTVVPSNWNGTFVVTASTTTSVSFINSSATGSYTSGGDITNLSYNTYFEMRGIGFRGDRPDVVYQVGNLDGSDSINEPIFDVWVSNANSTSNTGATAVEVNFITNGICRFIANTYRPGYGTGGYCGLNVRGAVFSTFYGSCSGQSYSMQITNISNKETYGNVFISMDMENSASTLAINGVALKVHDNLWLGGQWNFCSSVSGAGNGVVATAGARNIIMSPNIALGSATPAGTFIINDPTYSVGVQVVGLNASTVTTPPFTTANAQAFTNYQGQRVCVTIGPGTGSLSAVYITYVPGGTSYAMDVPTVSRQFILDPLATITAYYTTTNYPTVWSWSSIA